MVGMEINGGVPFDPENQTVTQLITWLQAQDPNAHVELDGGGTLRFRKMRNKDGGQIRVYVEHEEKPRRAKTRTERALEKAEVSRTTDPQQAQKVSEDANKQTGPGGRKAGDEDLFHEETKANQDKQAEEHADSVRGENKGKDQGGTVPGTSKTPSDKASDERGDKTDKGNTRKS